MHAAGWQIPNQVGALVFIVIERNPNDRKIERLLLAEGFLYVREQRGNRVWVNPQYPVREADADHNASVGEGNKFSMIFQNLFAVFAPRVHVLSPTRRIRHMQTQLPSTTTTVASLPSHVLTQ